MAKIKRGDRITVDGDTDQVSRQGAWMLTVHHLRISQSERVVWLCEELEIDYDLKLYDRRSDTRMAPAEYKALHPIGTAPIITDGDVVLPESGAILSYIIAKYGDGRLTVGPDQPNFADYLYWLHFANGSMMPSAVREMFFARIPGLADSEMVRGMRARLEAAYGLIETRLGEADYFAGPDLTAADIMNVFALTTMREFVPRDISACPNLLAYLGRIGARPAYQRAMAKAEPGMSPHLT